jgi:hypothetical protein
MPLLLRSHLALKTACSRVLASRARRVIAARKGSESSLLGGLRQPRIKLD